MKKPLKILTALCAAAVCVTAVSTAAGAVNTDTNYLRGDADSDGAVTISDATAIQRYLAELPSNNFFLKAADVNDDGLDVTDATEIQQFLADYHNLYRINEWVTAEEPTQPNTSPTYAITPGENELPFIPN